MLPEVLRPQHDGHRFARLVVGHLDAQRGALQPLEKLASGSHQPARREVGLQARVFLGLPPLTLHCRQNVRRHVVATIERFDAGEQGPRDDAGMAAQDGKAPLRPKAAAHEGDPLVAQGLAQVVDVVGALLDGVAAQVDPFFRKLRGGGSGRFDESSRVAGQAGRLIERLRRVVVERQEVAARAVAALVHEHHVADGTEEVEVLRHRLGRIALCQRHQKGIARAAGEMERRRRVRRLRGSKPREAHADDPALRIGTIFRHVERAQVV